MLKIQNRILPYALVFAGTLGVPITAWGHGAGNGGALIERNGKVLTFKDAGISIPLPFKELEEKDLPELEVFEAKLARISMTSDIRYRMIKTSQSSESRKYFKVDLASLPPADVKRIMASYRKAVITRPGDQVVLAAITRDQETYLFDRYFELQKPNSKLAILAHEAFWITNPDAKYTDVIDAEMKFETCADAVDALPAGEVAYCEKWIAALAKVIMEPTLPLGIAANDDLVTGKLKPILNGYGRIPLSFIIPDQFFDLSASDLQKTELDSIRAMVHDRLTEQSARYPGLRLLKELKRRVATLRILGLQRVASLVWAPGLKEGFRAHDQDIDRTLRTGNAESLGFKPWVRPTTMDYQYSRWSDFAYWEGGTAKGWVLSLHSQWVGSTVVLTFDN